MSSIDLSELYLKTNVSVEVGGILVSAQEATSVMNGVIHVITAWNPGDARPSRTENDAANDQLLSRLTVLGCEPRRAVGADPDSGHFEESWAVEGLSDDQARAVGAEFGQVAVFRLSGDVQTVLACFETWERSRTL